jgi:hypothetical protein
MQCLMSVLVVIKSFKKNKELFVFYVDMYITKIAFIKWIKYKIFIVLLV